MHRTPWFLHPLFVFIFSILALAASLFLTLYWYISARKGLERIVAAINIAPDQALQSETWVVILVLSLLVGIISLGIFTIFVYHQKVLQLYRLQHNFINNFTHELKTPVTSLKLFLETFRKHDLPVEDRQRYLEFMIRDVGRLSDTINRILSLARLESGSYQGHFAVGDLGEAVRQCCEANRSLLQDCELDLAAAAEAGLRCRLDRPLFDMLLENLLTNAIKYNPGPRARIAIAIERSGRRRNRALLRVRDNGIGLEARELKRIFNKFYQVERSDHRPARGSGLGLNLVQNIARLHRGQVWAESAGPGSGATFSLSLPLASDPADQALPPVERQDEHQGHTPKNPGGGG